MKYKEARAIFENEDWTEEESALFYYRWFGEERLVEDLNEGLECGDYPNKKEFVKLVKEIKRMNERDLEYEKKFKAYLFRGDWNRHKEICNNINVVESTEETRSMRK